MKCKEIIKDVYLIEFPNQYEMCSTFFRIQEFYESPSNKLRGKYFTLEEAIDYYAYLYNKKKPEFTYFTDWHGFNIPDHVLEDFDYIFNVLEGDITLKENNLFGILPIYKRNKYYVIGAIKGDKDVIYHELAHALFYLNKDYKKEMKKLVNELPKRIRKRVEKHLLNIGYSKTVLADEIQAYFSTGLRDNMLTEKQLEKSQKHINLFKETFNKYLKIYKVKL